MSELLRDHPEILLNQTIKKTYQILKVLGKGTFSVVFQCTAPLTQASTWKPGRKWPSK
jgi:predicted Ser/Thr protein kinase